MATCDLNKEKTVLEQIAHASEAIRKKHKLIKLGKDNTERALNEVLKPVVTPLQTLVEQTSDPEISQGRRRRRKHQNHAFPTALDIPSRELTATPRNPRKRKRGNDGKNSDDDDDVYDESNADDVLELPMVPFNIQDSRDPGKLNTDELSLQPITETGVINNDEDDDENDNIDHHSFSEGENEQDLAWGYLQLLTDPKRKNELDSISGVRMLNDRLVIGVTPISFEQRRIQIGDDDYAQTPGFLELLFKAEPRVEIITDDDKKAFTKVVEATHLDKRYYNPSQGLRRHNRKKFDDFMIKRGGGLPTQMIARRKRNMDYVYWDDPNELVDRLRLLCASQAAGHNNHNNEIISIIEELREAGLIY